MIPKYLYHYTSLEVLKLILTNKTFRFKRLDLLNDPLEGQIERYNHVKKFIFTSSWTANEIDEIPMWKMYTELKGVRLRMPIDLFCFDNLFEIQKRRESFQLISNLHKDYKIDYKSNININLSANPFIIKKVFGPTMIEYVRNEDSLGKNSIYKTSAVNDFEFYEVELDQVARQKLNFWEFEKEYRFFIYPGVMIAGSDQVLQRAEEVIEIKSEYIDVEYNEKALQGVEILFGPLVTNNFIQNIEKIINNLGLNNYNLQKSKIQIR